ncbi:GH25 family lysozyme [Planktotalea sp.]|uniref:GH25 family lysozyme n=1 Tax=Planktotalea sp. TaxID=2029877 RepID=UPI003298CAF4
MTLTRRATLTGLASLPMLSAPSLVLARSKFNDNDPINFGRRGPATFPVHGIDAARFQGQMNWRQIRQEGVRFAWLKATEGGDLLDPEFKANWRAAKRARVPVGAYHFYYFCTDPDTQAKWFIKNVPRLRGGLPPVLDLEWNPFSPTCTLRPPAAEVRRVTKRFTDIVERHYQTRVVVYTALDFWEANNVAQYKRDFWLRSTAKHVEQRFTYRDWRFWQYTSTGVINGIEKEVDINCFNGTEAKWKSWLSSRSVR